MYFAHFKLARLLICSMFAPNLPFPEFDSQRNEICLNCCLVQCSRGTLARIQISTFSNCFSLQDLPSCCCPVCLHYLHNKPRTLKKETKACFIKLFVAFEGWWKFVDRAAFNLYLFYSCGLSCFCHCHSSHLFLLSCKNVYARL